MLIYRRQYDIELHEMIYRHIEAKYYREYNDIIERFKWMLRKYRGANGDALVSGGVSNWKRRNVVFEALVSDAK